MNLQHQHVGRLRQQREEAMKRVAIDDHRAAPAQPAAGLVLAVEPLPVEGEIAHLNDEHVLALAPCRSIGHAAVLPPPPLRYITRGPVLPTAAVSSHGKPDL
jgi:hypothetical protein